MQQLGLHFALIIPCYNEQQCISAFFADIRIFQQEFVSKYREHQLTIIVVDNESTDESLKLLTELSQSLSYIKIRTCPVKGYGAALKTGFTSAYKDINADYYGFCDLDSTYPLMAFLEMYQIIQYNNSDIIFANRMHQQQGMPFQRRVGNLLYREACRLLYGSKLNDVCTGQRIFSANKVNEVLCLKENGLNFSMALTCCVLKRHWIYHEIPITYGKRLGESKLSSLSDGIKFLITLLRWKFKNEM